MTGANDSGLHESDVEGDGHLVTDENTSSLERCVPGEAEVFAVDLCSRREPQAGIAPGILCGWGRSTVKTTLRVTPRMVRSPATASSPVPVRLMRFDLNDSVGNFST